MYCTVNTHLVTIIHTKLSEAELRYLGTGVEGRAARYIKGGERAGDKGKAALGKIRVRPLEAP